MMGRMYKLANAVFLIGMLSLFLAFPTMLYLFEITEIPESMRVGIGVVGTLYTFFGVFPVVGLHCWIINKDPEWTAFVEAELRRHP